MVAPEMQVNSRKAAPMPRIAVLALFAAALLTTAMLVLLHTPAEPVPVAVAQAAVSPPTATTVPTVAPAATATPAAVGVLAPLDCASPAGPHEAAACAVQGSALLPTVAPAAPIAPAPVVDAAPPADLQPAPPHWTNPEHPAKWSVDPHMLPRPTAAPAALPSTYRVRKEP